MVSNIVGSARHVERPYTFEHFQMAAPTNNQHIRLLAPPRICMTVCDARRCAIILPNSRPLEANAMWPIRHHCALHETCGTPIRASATSTSSRTYHHPTWLGKIMSTLCVVSVGAESCHTMYYSTKSNGRATNNMWVPWPWEETHVISCFATAHM